MDQCAPGWRWRMANHSRVVDYDRRTYRNLPKYEEIEAGHVRSMARYFGILECAKAKILNL